MKRILAVLLHVIDATHLWDTVYEEWGIVDTVFWNNFRILKEPIRLELFQQKHTTTVKPKRKARIVVHIMPTLYQSMSKRNTDSLSGFIELSTFKYNSAKSISFCALSNWLQIKAVTLPTREQQPIARYRFFAITVKFNTFFKQNRKGAIYLIFVHVLPLCVLVTYNSRWRWHLGSMLEALLHST